MIRSERFPLGAPLGWGATGYIVMKGQPPSDLVKSLFIYEWRRWVSGGDRGSKSSKAWGTSVCFGFLNELRFTSAVRGF